MSERRSHPAVDRGRVADQIYADLRDQILRGSLLDGAKLPAEKDLAEAYGVSGATIREAIRALTTIGLVDVRHGSGCYVTAQAGTLVAMSIGSVAQLGKVRVRELLGTLAVLNVHAAELAAHHATPEEIASLRAAVHRLDIISSADQAAADLKEFLWQLSAISHNGLLAALCRFLVEVQIEIALELSGRQLESWRKIAGGLQEHRIALVEALERRDAEAAATVMRTYHDRAIAVIAALSKTEKTKISDELLGRVITSLIRPGG